MIALYSVAVLFTQRYLYRKNRWSIAW